MAETAEATRVEEFLGRLVGDWKGLFVSLMAILGDRLDLFRALAKVGPATSAELAEAAGCTERYVREWANCLVAAEYLRYEPESGRYSLSPEARVVLAEETTPAGMSGMYQNFGGMLRTLDPLADAFRHGGGVALDQYGDDLFGGTRRSTAAWHDHLLVQHWIPAVPGLAERLEAGARGVDIGCGQGRAVIRLATEYPKSRFVGVDAYPPNIEAARTAAEDAGVAERAAFEVRDAAKGLDGSFDLVTAFDVVHDAADPGGLLAAMRRVLEPDGVCLILEISCGPDVTDNLGPVGAIGYGMSVMYCMTTSLAAGGAGLGTHGLPEPVLREMATEAGFSVIERAPVDSPFNTLFVLSP